MKLFRLFIAFFLLASISCVKEFSNETNSTPFAEGTLKDSSGDCLHDSVAGSFYNGVQPDADTNYIEVGINISHPGSFYIATDVQNGFYFADSGYFNNAVDTVIRLHPIGIPSSVANTFFTIQFDSDVCYIYVPVTDSTGTSQGGQDSTGTTDSTQSVLGTWQFTQGSTIYSGPVTSATQTHSGVALTLVQLGGVTASGTDTAMNIYFSVPAAKIQTGTYTTAVTGNTFSFADTSKNVTLFVANPSTRNTNLTLSVTSYNATSQKMNATFSGTVQTTSGSIVTIEKGSLKVTFP